MREDRKAIIGGGLSVMRAVFKLLRIERMQVADGGLRHGLICDMMAAMVAPVMSAPGRFAGW